MNLEPPGVYGTENTLTMRMGIEMGWDGDGTVKDGDVLRYEMAMGWKLRW